MSTGAYILLVPTRLWDYAITVTLLHTLLSCLGMVILTFFVDGDNVKVNSGIESLFILFISTAENQRIYAFINCLICSSNTTDIFIAVRLSSFAVMLSFPRNWSWWLCLGEYFPLLNLYERLSITEH